MMSLIWNSLSVLIGFGALILFFVIIPMMFRTVVKTNEVHIVQRGRKTVSYGKDLPGGNVYYSWPAWVPVIGLRVINLPVSVFSLKLESYEAYDKGRVPFGMDIMAFFQIDEPNVAAQRVESIKELKEQLIGILQGATRAILSAAEINDILEKRAEYGHAFTEATTDQLRAWGVKNVKSIELMDIHDIEGSQVIHNIQSMKQSHISMESRIAVAQNNQAATLREIEAKQVAQVRGVEADQIVAMRGVEKDRTVQVSTEEARQVVQTQQRLTMEKTMAVKEVEAVRTAEIARSAEVVKADQSKQVLVINTEGEKQQQVLKAEGEAAAAVARADGERQMTTLVAEGNLQKALKAADGIRAEGLAKGEADTAVNAATVAGQITLAKEIGTNDGYQKYLVSVKQIEIAGEVGKAQAHSLEAAHIKVIATGGSIIDGVKGVTDLLTPKGGNLLGGALDALSNSEAGQAVLTRLGIKTNGSAETHE